MLEEDDYLRDVNYDIIRDIVYTVLIKRVYSSIINNSRVNNIIQQIKLLINKIIASHLSFLEGSITFLPVPEVRGAQPYK